MIDDKTQDVEAHLRNCDVVLHRQDARALEKPLHVRRPSGGLVSITGLATPDFGAKVGASRFLKPMYRTLHLGTYC